MIKYFTIPALFIVTACGTSTVKEENSNTEIHTDTLAAVTEGTPETVDSLNSDFATYYILIADTSSDYYFLQKKMYALSKPLKLSIDTMGRYYNKAKNLIVLPDDDEDEIYRGEFYPRRDPSEYLSLEYLSFFKLPAGDKTLALVTGIYEKESSCDSALTVLKKAETKGFKIRSEVYIGCMH
jgi:hypothetical protein